MTDSADANGVTLDVRTPGLGQWIGRLVNGALFGSVDASDQGPRVVAVNRFGKEVTVRQYRSTKKALDGCAELEREMNDLGYRDWCQKYAVPPHFEMMQT